MRFFRQCFFLVSLAVITAGCTPSNDSSNSSTFGPKTFNQNTPEFTAVVVAYEPELDGILATIENHEQAHITQNLDFKGVTYRLGEFQGEPILVFATGMSIANAAMSMQMAFDYFPIKQVVYMGIAGAVNPQWQPGDVIVPARWYYHDESVYSNPNPNDPENFIIPEYYQRFLDEQESRRNNDPYLPSYKSFGLIHPDEVIVIKEGMDKPEDKAYFSATPRLLAAAKKAIEKMPAQMILDEREAILSVGGNGVTGSVFLDNREYRKWVRDVFNAEVTEMESASVAQVSYINDIDWVIIRAISDLAGGQEGVNVEHIYDKEVSRVGAEVLFATLEEIIQ